MQHADSLISSSEAGPSGKKAASGPSLPDEDQPRGIVAPLKEGVAAGRDAVKFYLAYLHPTNLAAAAAKARTMTALELALAGVASSFWFCYGVGFCVIKIGASVSGVVLFLMRGERLFGRDQKKKGVNVGGMLASAIVAVPAEAADGNGTEEGVAAAATADAGNQAAGVAGALGQIGQKKEAAATVDLQKRQAAVMAAVEKRTSAKSTKTEPSAVSTINFGEYIKKVISFLARNFFTMKFIALSIAFLINFMLLFYKVSVMEDDSADDELEELAASVDQAGTGGDEGGGEEEEGEVDEFVHVNETYYYLEYIIRFLGMVHAVISLCMLIAYYNLKVPLAIFKREKEVARR